VGLLQHYASLACMCHAFVDMQRLLQPLQLQMAVRETFLPIPKSGRSKHDQQQEMQAQGRRSLPWFYPTRCMQFQAGHEEARRREDRLEAEMLVGDVRGAARHPEKLCWAAAGLQRQQEDVLAAKYEWKGVSMPRVHLAGLLPRVHLAGLLPATSVKHPAAGR
jgi:hypothetical protein